MSRDCRDDRRDCDEELAEKLERNIGRIVTIFTESGGCSGNGFSGLLVKVTDCIVKLITELPCKPSSPFGVGVHCGGSDVGNKCGRCRDAFGTAVIIPIEKIVAVVENEI